MRRGLLRLLIDLLLPEKVHVRASRNVTREVLEPLMRPRLVEEIWITALFSYRNPIVRNLIKGIKYYGVEEPLHDLGELTAEYLIEVLVDRQSLKGWGRPVIVPVPLSRARMHKRGYNQAERIARHIYEHLKDSADFKPNALTRDERKSQTEVSKKDRRENISRTFSIKHAESVEAKNVILIDDVVETGSTLKDARRALLLAGAADVIAIAIAH